MPTDLTTAEKAERLGLIDSAFSGNAAYVDALYAERFPEFTVGTGIHPNAPSLAPAPDYRAALERLVDVAEQIENAGPGHEDWGALTNAIAHARKVLHGQ